MLTQSSKTTLTISLKGPLLTLIDEHKAVTRDRFLFVNVTVVATKRSLALCPAVKKI